MGSSRMANMRGYSAIGLYNPKNVININTAIRSAHNYNASLIALSGKRYKRISADTTAAYKHIPLIETDNLFSVNPYDAIPIAIELDDQSESLLIFCHPERAYYIFGPEDGSLPESVMSKCKYRLFVPTKACMNLATTVGVVLYDRLAKQEKNETSSQGNARSAAHRFAQH